MHDDDPDDEDWYDDENATDEEEPGRCPECGGAVYEFSDRCPACGRWLTAADRRKLWRSESTPTWVKLAALILLVALIVAMLTVVPIGF